MQISADGKQLHAGMRVWLWDDNVTPPHLEELTIERVDVHAVRFVERPGVRIRLADGADCYTSLRSASEAAFTPIDLDELEAMQPDPANVMHGPLDGLYLPAPPEQRPWLMLVSYADRDADNAVPACYWWRAEIQRWVFQPTATSKSVAGVQGRKEAT